MRSDQRIAIYWPKSYLLVLFIIIVKRHESDKAIQRKKKGKKKESDRRRKRRKNKSQILSVVSELYPKRFKLEIVLSRLPCRHPYNHFAVGRLKQNDKTALSQCVPSRCLWYQRVKQKSALKIAVFHVSDWLRSATAWGLWMGPYRVGVLHAHHCLAQVVFLANCQIYCAWACASVCHFCWFK